jgi:hypothetical protein
VWLEILKSTGNDRNLAVGVFCHRTESHDRHTSLDRQEFRTIVRATLREDSNGLSMDQSFNNTFEYMSLIEFGNHLKVVLL